MGQRQTQQNSPAGVVYHEVIGGIDHAPHRTPREIHRASAIDRARLRFGGFADAHSAAASAAALAAKGVLTDGAAAAGVMMAVLTNTVTKIVVAAVSGGRRYAIRLAGPLLTMAAAGAAAAWLTLQSP